jgi:arsenical pump membrane protein
LAIAIFILTLALVIWQPRGLGIGYTALGGALLALATGVVTLQDISIVWALVWNATFTTIALVIIALILSAAGVFEWIALWLAYASFGRGHLLFALVLLFGASVTALLNNCSTALIWTPVLIEMLLVLGFTPKATWAFVFATGFIADATSLPLPISNLVNIVTIDYFQIPVLDYVLVMIPVNFVAIATGITVLWFYCDGYIPFSYHLDPMPPPSSAIRDPLVCQWSFPILGLLPIAYFLAQPLNVPFSAITASGALVMLALAGRWFDREDTAVIAIDQVFRDIPWQVILFVLGLFIITLSLCNTALTTLLTQLLKQLSGWGLTQVAIGTGFIAALLAGVMNNFSAGLINALAINDSFGSDSAVREVMIYASAIGCNIGAKITPIGSLSTLLWLDVLARKGQALHWSQYSRIAFILTFPVLVVSLLSLAIWLPWLIA